MCASIRFKDKFPTYNLTWQNDEHWFWNFHLRYFSHPFTTGLAWCWHWLFAVILKYTTTMIQSLQSFAWCTLINLLCVPLMTVQTIHVLTLCYYAWKLSVIITKLVVKGSVSPLSFKKPMEKVIRGWNKESLLIKVAVW